MYKLLNSKDIIFKICVVCAVGFVVAVLLGTLYVSKDIDSSGRVGNGRFEISADQQLVGQPQQVKGKEIRYRDLSWWRSTVFTIKKQLGMIKIPTIASKTKLFYEVN